MRRVFYVTGTRADYGLMRATLSAITAHSALSLEIVVTGMHLDPDHGLTVREIEVDGFAIAARVPVDYSDAPGFMARAIAAVIAGCCDVFAQARPDLVLLLGDRGEMLGAAIAALHLNIPIAHIHGGERSGTVDEPVRHAISKLAHLHLPATAGAAARLVRMGERPERVHVVGAPGLDGIAGGAPPRAALLVEAGLPADSKLALMLFHPVVQEAADGARQASLILAALRARGYAIALLKPNADAGGLAIRDLLEAEAAAPDIRLFTHMPRAVFTGWMAAADVMIGNSSAGIIEAASFGTPVVNVGSRQSLRERNANVIDAAPEAAALAEALTSVERIGRSVPANIYGDGHTAERIAALLASAPLDAGLLDKACAY